jgi:hypothetical protein
MILPTHQSSEQMTGQIQPCYALQPCVGCAAYAGGGKGIRAVWESADLLGWAR